MMTNNVKVISCYTNNRPSSILSLLQGEEVFASRILSRSEDSKGFSSRVYYLDGAGSQVPFEWEARPGQPKVVVAEESCPLPPLSPPPAILSSILAKEQRHTPPSKPGWKKKNRFWKKSRKPHNVESSPDSSGLWMYDGDSFSSPRFSTSSSSSYSSSSSSSSYSSKCPSPVRNLKFPPPAQLGNIKRRWGVEGLDWVLACTPWKPSGDHGLAARNHEIGCSM